MKYRPLIALVVVLSGCSSEAPAGVDGGPGSDAGTGVDAPSATGETGRMIGMTAAHNAARDRVGATPAIPNVEWSTDLAAVAQAWSEHLASSGCNLVHSGGDYGENLFWVSGSHPEPSVVVDSWYSEVECYSYGTFMGTDACSSACDRFGGCGHYTQVTWRDTQRIGCGMAACSSGAEIWTCNYDPPGNYVGRSPY
jgi:pathogenesis-related protein 1